MYAEVAWVLLSSGAQVQPQVILDPDYLPDYLSVSYDYDFYKDFKMHKKYQIKEEANLFLIVLNYYIIIFKEYTLQELNHKQCL